MRLAVIILNYRRGAMTVECLASLEDELDGHDDRCAVVVDNGSDDGSADEIAAAIERRGWSSWARLVRAGRNGGFAAGNNVGFRAADAELYVLLNSDARARPGAIEGLLAAAARHPDAGMIGPRLEDPDGTPQESCFRFRTPVSELLEAAGTSLLDRLFPYTAVALPVTDRPRSAPWVSFACILIRRAVVDDIGPMDEGYFMYFEDIDYARHARQAGWRVVHEPAACVVHLRGGTSSVKAAMQQRRRVPAYYYASRSRYFARWYGGTLGLWLTNLLWATGRAIALLREVAGTKRPHARAREWMDNWMNALQPFRPPRLPRGGEL